MCKNGKFYILILLSFDLFITNQSFSINVFTQNVFKQQNPTNSTRQEKKKKNLMGLRQSLDCNSDGIFFDLKLDGHYPEIG